MLGIKTTLFAIITMLGLSTQAHAGLILFTDREAFENAGGTPLAFDGFNDKALTTIDISTNSGFKPYRTTSSHVSEGEKAMSIYERDTLTFNFGYEVFAIGFDLNELNASTLSYFDSAGHQIINAFVITEQWNASTFFGLISDTAITSFSLVGNGEQSLRATYGIDAMSYTAAANAVPAPATWLIIISGLFSLMLARRAKHHNQ